LPYHFQDEVTCILLQKDNAKLLGLKNDWFVSGCFFFGLLTLPKTIAMTLPFCLFVYLPFQNIHFKFLMKKHLIVLKK